MNNNFMQTGEYHCLKKHETFESTALHDQKCPCWAFSYVTATPCTPFCGKYYKGEESVIERFENNIPREVGAETEFGYKVEDSHDGITVIYTVTDWGRIKSFLLLECERARKEERERINELVKWMKEEGRVGSDWTQDGMRMKERFDKLMTEINGQPLPKKDWYITGTGLVIQPAPSTRKNVSRQAFLGSYATEEEAKIIRDKIKKEYGQN